jgi:HD-GYP domain-containing protein (c-di-GMP phosphodiesterase class II)
MNLNHTDETLTGIMTDILESDNYDIIKIFCIDPQIKSVYESNSIDRSCAVSDADAFSYGRLEPVILLLSSQRDTVVFDKDKTLYGNVFYHKLNKQLMREIFVPVFDYNSEVVGFIYLAKKDGGPVDLSHQKYLNKMNQLIHLIEKNIFSFKINESLFDTVLLMCEIINAKEPYLIGNLYAICHWAVKIAKYLNLPAKDIQKLQLVTLMHDLGKIYIDDRILNKKGKLTSQEYEIMKTRVIHSYEIALKLAQLYELEDIPQIILSYQERIDGNGYPNGIMGQDIPVLSKILLVAKALVSMLTNKQYRNAKPIDEIINEFKIYSNTQFDADVAEAAILLLIYEKDEYNDCFEGIGNYVTMNITLKSHDPEVITMWGNIRKTGNSYVFSSVGRIPDFKIIQVAGCDIYLNINERIYHFKPVLQNITFNKILISDIEIQNEDKSVSIKWFLEGNFIPRTRSPFKIFINLFGGDFLDFYVFDAEVPEPITNGIIQISLSDGKDTNLPGVIVFRQQLEDKVFYRFKYANVSNSVSREVFSSIFRKQLEIRNLIKDTNYFKTAAPYASRKRRQDFLNV